MLERAGTGTLPTSTDRLLDELWARIQEHRGGVPSTELRDIACHICADVLAVGWGAEDLAIAVRDSWGERKRRLRFPEIRELEGLVTQFVSLCIDEYFIDSADGRRPSERADAR